MVAFAILCLGAKVYAQDVQKSTKVWVTIESQESIPQENQGRWVGGDDQLRNIFETYQVKSCEQALPASRKETLLKVYEIEAVGTFDRFAHDLTATEFCHTVDPAPVYELLSVAPFPDDYNLTFAEDYALDLIDAEKAWEYSTGDTNTIVGIADGGFYLNHEELQGEYVYAQNPSYVSMSMYMHGTAVSTIAAGNTNNGIGKSAIGYDCRLALSTIGYNQILELCYAGARVINVSWTSGCQYLGYYDLIMEELFESNCIVVAAAGNGSTCGGPNSLVYPSALDGVISVTSVGPWDNHERTPGNPATSHQHNATVDICAPGYDVAGTSYPGFYITGSGTSFAAPYVTGTIGLMLSLRPCLTRQEVIDIISITAKDIYGVNPADYDGLLGAGRLDAGAALEYVNNYNCQNPPLVVDGNVGVVTPNGTPRSAGNSSAISIHSSQADQVANVQDETLDPMEVVLFPNPNKGTFKVSWNGINPDQVLVLDGTGRVVLERSIVSGEKITEIVVGQTGVYFVRLLREGNILANEKAVVQ